MPWHFCTFRQDHGTNPLASMTETHYVARAMSGFA